VFVTGEPGGSLTSTRRAIEERLGAARCVDIYALTELGVVGWSCAGPAAGLHLDEDDFTFEVVDPDGEEPAPDGGVGELVVTSRAGLIPLERYRTGDLVCF